MAMIIDTKRRHSSPVSGLSHKSLQFSIVSIGAQLRITVAILEEDLTLKSSFQTIFAHFGGVKIKEFR